MLNLPPIRWGEGDGIIYEWGGWRAASMDGHSWPSLDQRVHEFENVGTPGRNPRRYFRPIHPYTVR